MVQPKNLNDPNTYAEALCLAATSDSQETLMQWLADTEEVAKDPLVKRYEFFAQRLQDMAPRPELGFKARTNRQAPAPKIGRNDPCPCGSGKKFKSCHINEAEKLSFKLGNPTAPIMAAATAQLISEMEAEALDDVPRDKLTDLAASEMASCYYRNEETEVALELLKGVLDGPREHDFMLYDYWIARYAEWLVEIDQAKEAEEFLMDEYDAPRGTEKHQVAQKLGAFYLDQGDPGNAETWIETALEQDGQNPFNHYLKGLTQHATGNWEPAIASYQTAMTFTEAMQGQEQGALQTMVQEAMEKAQRQELPDAEEETATEEA
ncbi:SEC-C metal-binding domain-containing protein [Magnetococcus sp. PR-3]|uniref:SEC-C metal-binding domain-containing protein n=1 Tax=Magnetococcus sp. PR-3 TaxID=3120355 RepID=UPI002FCE6807